MGQETNPEVRKENSYVDRSGKRHESKFTQPRQVRGSSTLTSAKYSGFHNPMN